MPEGGLKPTPKVCTQCGKKLSIIGSVPKFDAQTGKRDFTYFYLRCPASDDPYNGRMGEHSCFSYLDLGRMGCVVPEKMRPKD